MANLSDVIYKMIDNAHPVGSYYLTETDTNPSAILHVGTWVQLKDRMLIGCGDSFAISSEGGEKEHTISVTEIPSHTHTKGTMNITGTFGGYGDRTGFSTLSGAFWDKQHQTRIPSLGDIVDGHSTSLVVGFDASRSWTGETSSVGGDTPINVMNPYHACFIWRRIE